MKKLFVIIFLGLMMSSCSLFLYDYQAYPPVRLEYQYRVHKPIYRGVPVPPRYSQPHNHHTVPVQHIPHQGHGSNQHNGPHYNGHR